MKTIYKYEFQTADIVKIDLPDDAKILCVQRQRGHSCIWAIVNPNNELHRRVFRIYGTGHALDADHHGGNYKYIGTYQEFDGKLVWHLFEILQTKNSEHWSGKV